MWLRYATCLAELEQMEEAIAAFRRVMDLAPLNQEARIRLAELLTKLGRPEEALEAVTQVHLSIPRWFPTELVAFYCDLVSVTNDSIAFLCLFCKDWDTVRIEATLLHHRCLLLLQEEHWDQFIQAFKLLISRHAKNIRYLLGFYFL